MDCHVTWLSKLDYTDAYACISIRNKNVIAFDRDICFETILRAYSRDVSIFIIKKISFRLDGVPLIHILLALLQYV